MAHERGAAHDLEAHNPDDQGLAERGSAEQGTGLPASFEMAWGYRAPASRGPKRGLSLDRIVTAAIEVATADGLDAVSMSRVAKQLGTAPMSLYRYVAAKDELLLLMLDAASVPVPTPAQAGEGWRAGLTRWCRGYQEVLNTNPWLLRITLSASPVTPNQIRWLESALASLCDSGLRYDEKLAAVLALSGLVRTMETLEADIMAARVRAPGTAAAMTTPTVGRALLRVANPAEFPQVHAMLAEGIFEAPETLDPEKDFGIDRILDGLEMLIDSRRAATGDSSGS